MAGRILDAPKRERNILDRALEEFPVVDDQKLRMSLITQADKWNQYARDMIYKTYQDNELLLIYKAARDNGIFQTGGKTRVRREVVRFPNGYVFNFCRAVFESMYGPDWMINKKVWMHELIRPWMLITLKK